MWMMTSLLLIDFSLYNESKKFKFAAFHLMISLSASFNSNEFDSSDDFWKSDDDADWTINIYRTISVIIRCWVSMKSDIILIARDEWNFNEFR